MTGGLYRLLDRLQSRMMLLVGRAILTAVYNDEGTQKVQVKGFADEVLDDMERLQEYGVESRPLSGAEVLLLCPFGNRQLALATRAHDRRYRPTTLDEGEVCLYTDEGVFLLLKRGNILEVPTDVKELDIGGKAVVDLDGDAMNVDMSSIKLGSAVKKLIHEEFITLFNAHVHSGVKTGGGSSGSPTTPMSTATHATSKTEAE